MLQAANIFERVWYTLRVFVSESLMPK